MDTNTIIGKVAQVNDKGLKLEGADSWVNVSKWAENVVMPARGQQVTLTVDKAGFIRAIAPATTNGHEAPAPVAPRAASCAGRASAAEAGGARLAAALGRQCRADAGHRTAHQSAGLP